MMDKWMDDGCLNIRENARSNNVALAHPYHQGK